MHENIYPITLKVPIIWERKGEAGREEGTPQKGRDSTKPPKVCLNKVMRITIYYKGQQRAVLRLRDVNSVCHLFL